MVKLPGARFGGRAVPVSLRTGRRRRRKEIRRERWKEIRQSGPRPKRPSLI